ncbi:MAG: tyrosine-type recombinase/integrase [Nitrospinae bacterium]|nr:tyrosine-type recombinase/integrase [Nitrospinota bacterium]
MDRLHPLPQLRRLHVFGQHNQELVTAYLKHLQTRQYAPTTLQTTIDALNSFCRRVPLSRQPRLSQTLASTTAEDIEAWLQAAHHAGLAPSTIHTILKCLHRFFAFLQDHGRIAQQPIQWRRHQVLVPQTLPRPMPADDLLRFFRVIDRLRDRTMFLLMLRCGLRVGEVSTLTWPAINVGAGSIRIDNGKGQVDRVVYDAADVAEALRHWRRWQPLEVTSLFPSALKPGLPLGVRAIQQLMARYLKAAGVTQPYSPHSLRQSLCHPTAQRRCPLGGRERAHGPPDHQYDTPLHATL